MASLKIISLFLEITGVREFPPGI